MIPAHAGISDSDAAAWDNLDDNEPEADTNEPHMGDMQVHQPAHTPLDSLASYTAAAALQQSPETRVLSIPSNWVTQDQRYSPIELHLRLKQADQCLQALRDTIADKSFQYSHVIRVAPRKGVRTRARGAIAKLNCQIAYHARVYGRCCQAMERLGADDAILNKYKVLLKDDLRSSTALLNPNEPGSTCLTLSWIWLTAANDVGTGPQSLKECKLLLSNQWYFLFKS